MAQKKGGGSAKVADVADIQARDPLQAVLLADSFTQRFRPITLERPKVLLPLVNVPMIKYTLLWLESVGVEEVFVFCCAHAKQVTSYLENNGSFGSPSFKVTAIESNDSISAGDALRTIFERGVIKGDFVLISGDTVSNMSLTQALQEHKERRKKDPLAVMTMVIRQSKPSPITNQTRLGNDELVLVIDPESSQLLYYEEKAQHSRGVVSIDRTFLADRPAICIYNDKQDCFIDICSPEVLSLFTDNFDYQQLRRDFVKGLLMDEILGYKIFTHEIHSSYAARVDNFRSYDTIGKDILQRWTYPLLPDVLSNGNGLQVKVNRQGVYKASDVIQSRSAHIGPLSLVGEGTVIGDNSMIWNSVIGRGCTIGCNVSIENCYIWDSVTIQDKCKLRHAVVCDGVVLKTGAVLEPGVILSFKVIIGEGFVVPAYSKISLMTQPTKQDSDEELEYADSSTGAIDSPSSTGMENDSNGVFRSKSLDSPCWDASEVGVSGAGYLWLVGEGAHEEEWRQSVAPVPADKLKEFLRIHEDKKEVSSPTANVNPTSGESRHDSGSVDDDEDEKDDDAYFEREVEETFRRAVSDVPGVKLDNVILEVNALRLAYNMTVSDCAGALFHTVLKLGVESLSGTSRGLFLNAKEEIVKWKGLLKNYLQSEDDEVEVLLKFEEICLESLREYSPIFCSILQVLYDEEIVTEDAILKWASEKQGADESDKIFLKQCEGYIQWLMEAEEEEE
ncbi:translation initiation factor eIF-2B subunit epsilon isoform X1 [Amborella trichopoda]|uniref:translation initiation factor eIF-2B subunit epsilon isoform X1 n=1 Tax=Amborella trichopoda TaxID=13333 RepID=UPI0005D3E254|nr:translation initiation factor eIF-2B subunit epsilon isoform X1 [Amborella trichopoda]|eukprot:XP_011621032.1 translation initiation factor eIF-2B subunit epsilon isoform X1 [Amborella trichopoda]